jgi:hypothetical protein
MAVEGGVFSAHTHGPCSGCTTQQTQDHHGMCRR